MSDIQDLYDSRVRPMVPAERLQLARLILDDLAPLAPSDEAIDVSDDWTDDDTADLAAYSTRHAAQPTAEHGTADEPR